MVTPISQEDRELAESFWEDCGKELLICLSRNNIPLYQPSSEDSHVVNAFSSICICICKYSYHNKRGKQRVKWLTDYPEKHPPEKMSIWFLKPIDIECRRYSMAPEALKFRYILAESWTLNGASNTRLSLIETDRSGRILRRSTEHQSGSIGVPPFSFPKQQVARINKVLFNNFLVRCWGMGPIPVWQFTEEGIAYYLGCPYTTLGPELTEAKDQAWNHLKSLLQSNAGDIAAILMAFTLFSVLKPFFPQFHRLDRSTPYLQVKKYFSEQLAICVSCMDLDKATQLAKLCCDIVPKLPPRFQIVDGVKIFQATEKMVRKDVSMSEFEAKVLQKAGVLWVGRKPSVEVSAQKLCLSLTIPATAKFPVEPFLQPLLAYFTGMLRNASVDNWEARQKAVFTKSIPVFKDLVDHLLAVANRHAFVFSGDTPKEWYQKNAESEALRLESLEMFVFRDVRKCRDEIGKWAIAQIDHLEEEFRNRFKQAHKDIQVIERKNFVEKQTLERFYEDVVEDVKKYGLDVESQKKVAYLLAAYQYFLWSCAPKEERGPMLAQLERALLREWQQFQPEIPVRDVLEAYLKKLISENRYARVRGKGSDRETVCLWYDPRERMFLLKNSYFPELKNLFAEDQKLTKRSWELLMEKAGFLETVERDNQTRRSFETRTKVGSSEKVPVLKIRAQILSEKFFAHKIVHIALQKMEQDTSSYRSGSRPNKKKRAGTS